MPEPIKLLQFLICKDFQEESKDFFAAKSVHSNIYVPKFPHTLRGHAVVTCWQKDKKFHKERLEFQTTDGTTAKTPHTDIEPVTDSVLFRWHQHPFPPALTIRKPTLLAIRVILDNHIQFDSYVLIEKKR